ncbi:hypothetical protein PT974_02587 [Cladobotryum mycophilum]|uniref:Cnl2/NKP2 family protein n=1 Tax=Cladobotryum mycophilum TaxID=491253 RepID=A0ABR0SYL9_9HYPO
MATESDILTNYLLQPAPLTSITTFDHFKAFFPRQLHDTPQLRALYRDLQAQRNAVVDAVAGSVAAEVKRGAAMRREVLRQRREADREDVDGEIELERALFGNDAGLKSAKHSLNSVIPELEGAVGAVEDEIRRLGEEEEALKESIKQTIGGLSDLRYGKLANGQLKDDILDGLTSLQEVCENKS